MNAAFKIAVLNEPEPESMFLTTFQAPSVLATVGDGRGDRDDGVVAAGAGALAGGAASRATMGALAGGAACRTGATKLDALVAVATGGELGATVVAGAAVGDGAAVVLGVAPGAAVVFGAWVVVGAAVALGTALGAAVVLGAAVALGAAAGAVLFEDCGAPHRSATVRGSVLFEYQMSGGLDDERGSALFEYQMFGGGPALLAPEGGGFGWPPATGTTPPFQYQGLGWALAAAPGVKALLQYQNIG